jgi:nucleoside-diphosphate-sugar epimerase
MVNPPPEEPLGGFSGNLVDVRDVALGHVLALEQEHAGGQRYITSNGRFTLGRLPCASVFDFLDNIFSRVLTLCRIDTFFFSGDELHSAGIKGIAPGGAPGSVPVLPQITVDGSKAERELGLKYTPRADTVIDAIKSIYERFPSVVPPA